MNIEIQRLHRQRGEVIHLHKRLLLRLAGLIRHLVGDLDLTHAVIGMHHVDEHPLVVLDKLVICDLGQRKRRSVRGLHRYDCTAVLRILYVAERRVIGTGNTLERVRHC